MDSFKLVFWFQLLTILLFLILSSRTVFPYIASRFPFFLSNFVAFLSAFVSWTPPSTYTRYVHVQLLWFLPPASCFKIFSKLKNSRLKTFLKVLICRSFCGLPGNPGGGGGGRCHFCMQDGSRYYYRGNQPPTLRSHHPPLPAPVV